MTPINIQVSRSRSMVKPILDKMGKGGISVSQTSVFVIVFLSAFQFGWSILVGEAGVTPSANSQQ